TWIPLQNAAFEGYKDIFEAIRNQENILHLVPFFSFDPIVKLLNAAADDPDVLAIKQTLYRVSGNSSVVQALQRAAERGKQVTVIVELKARFDEGNNIAWARKLEESGAHVVYGISGLKIHGKALLIVRREEGLIRRYVHLATGNYNDKTAKLYTDSSIFSYDQQLCAEIAALFNIMTGYATAQKEWSKIAVAPFDLRQRLLSLIAREKRHALEGGRGKIIAKMNSLTDPEIIVHLSDAAQAGVKIDLIVRGICCLKSGKNIRVCSIVDRYLEHSRIFYFYNNGHCEYFLSSADWMMRNLDRRIEIMFPLDNPAHQKIIAQILAMQLEDREKGRFLRSDGHYRSFSVKRYSGRRSQYRTYKLLEQLNRSRQSKTRDFVIFKSQHEAQKATNQEK
ncbi:MAG: polyphosphate kinase 1, partial [Victivallaceae bacterium]